MTDHPAQPAPNEPLTPEQQTSLNDLRWHWDEAYKIECDGRFWSAVSLANGDILRASTETLLRRQIWEHYAGNSADRIR